MKILLVEDDQPTGSALAKILAAHNHTVNIATDGQTGWELAETFEYDLILLDIIIPKLDGITLCKQLRAKGYEAPILLLTAKDSSTDRVMGLDAGADDYVVKPFDLDELMARIRALQRRGKVIPSPIITWENVSFDPINSEVRCGEQLLRLTPKEYCLLELFLLNPKRIFSRHAILNRLWDFAESPGEETVSTHIKCLRQKLKAAGGADLIETVYGLGYRLRSPSYNPESAALDQVAVQSGTSTGEQRKQGKQGKHGKHGKKSQENSVAEGNSVSASLPSGTQENRLQRVEATISRVWGKFKGDILAQVAVLEEAARALEAGNLTSQLWQDAKHEAHKLAGSLGIFGLMEGSRLARSLEEILKSEAALEAEQVKQISELVKSLRHQVSQEPQVSVATASPPKEAISYSPLILIVDDDLVFADRLRIEAIAWGLRVEIATDLSVARQMIAQAPPDIILLDLNFPSATEDGLTLLKELTERIAPIPAIALTARESLTDRVAVARLGGRAFLHKPLPAQEILKTVTEVLNQSHTTSGNRVMMVDDDPAILANLSALLQSYGLEVTTLQNPQQFWEVLTTCKPDLLILDLEMPSFNGLELCQVVRSDPHWHSLPIVFVSVHTAPEKMDQALAVGADEYISKSLDGTEVATRILRRLKCSNRQFVRTVAIGDENKEKGKREKEKN